MIDGHGWVRPRPDGAKARCGGPAICRECAIDAAQMSDETGYLESCCWSNVGDRRYCPGADTCKCRCHADARPGRTGGDPQTLLWVADDLRRVAEAHFKQAEVTGKRIDRKHLISTGNVLVERAQHYEKASQGKVEL